MAGNMRQRSLFSVFKSGTFYRIDTALFHSLDVCRDFELEYDYFNHVFLF